MSSRARGTIAEGSRPANPASSSTGADGSRQTVRYARTEELVSFFAGRGLRRGSNAVDRLRDSETSDRPVGGQMDYDTYGSSAVELAIDLANADLESAAAVETFLTSHAEWFTPDTSLALSDRDAAAVARTSRLIREVAVAGSEPDVRDRLNELLALARPRPYATDHDGELHLHYARPDAAPLEQLTTTVAMGLSQVVVQHGWPRLGGCSAGGGGGVLRPPPAHPPPPRLPHPLPHPLDRGRLPRPPQGLNGQRTPSSPPFAS